MVEQIDTQLRRIGQDLKDVIDQMNSTAAAQEEGTEVISSGCGKGRGNELSSPLKYNYETHTVYICMYIYSETCSIAMRVLFVHVYILVVVFASVWITAFVYL